MSDFAEEIYKLQELSGADFISQLKMVTARAEFHPLMDNPAIFTVGGERNGDYNNLLNAARKAVTHGFRVFILPNPKGGRTADFILEQHGVFKLCDLKTIHGNASVGNRLRESIGQCNRVLMNVRCRYDSRSMAFDIKHYFDQSPTAIEVMIFKGNRFFSVNRQLVQSPKYLKLFRKLYEK